MLLKGDRDGFRAVGGADPGEDRLEGLLDRGFGDREVLRDIRVGEPLTTQERISS